MTKKIFLINQTPLGGLVFSSGIDSHSDHSSPQARVDAYRGGNTPQAWTYDDPTGRLEEALEEARRAGRVIVDGRALGWHNPMTGDAWKPVVEAQLAASTPFRIGGFYRQNDGELVRLDTYPCHTTDPKQIAGFQSKYPANGLAFATRFRDGKPRDNDGARQLADGRYPGSRDDPKYSSHLIPGELDIQGNPVAVPRGWDVIEAGIPDPLAPKRRSILDVKPQPAPTLATSTHPADLAMIKRDGPTTPKPVHPTPTKEVKPAGKPWPLRATSPDLAPTSHMVNPLHGSASLL